jgi:hypothetical protein
MAIRIRPYRRAGESSDSVAVICIEVSEIESQSGGTEMATRAERIHEMLAAHHAAAQSEHHKAMKGEEKESSRYAFHKNMMEHHADQQQDHLAELEDCAKTAKAAGSELVPTLVSGVVPEQPRAVLRAGQSPIPGAVLIKDLQIRQVIGLDGEDLHSEELSLQK